MKEFETEIDVVRAYLWEYRGHKIITRLVKNGIWRWYSTSPTLAFGSNSIMHWHVIKYAKLAIDEFEERSNANN